MSASLAVRPDSVLAQNKELLRQFTELMDKIPSAVDDGGASMLLAILEADDFDTLKGESGLPNSTDLDGRTFLFTELHKRDSTLENGLPYFLVVTGVDKMTGEEIMFQTSAGSVFFKLTKAYAKGWWPLLGTFKKSSKPTEAGYFPMNLNVLAHGTDAQK